MAAKKTKTTKTAARKPKTVKAPARQGQPKLFFVGRRKLSNKEFVDLDAPPSISFGGKEYELPSSDDQRNGFEPPIEVERALKSMYPFWYKNEKPRPVKPAAQKAEVN